MKMFEISIILDELKKVANFKKTYQIEIMNFYARCGMSQCKVNWMKRCQSEEKLKYNLF